MRDCITQSGMFASQARGTQMGPGKRTLDSAHKGAWASHRGKPPSYRKPTIAGATAKPIDAATTAGHRPRIAPDRA
jgi:hypothetical protein